MSRYHGGSQVGAGFYWNVAAWTIETIGKEGDLLPGGAEHRYVKLPMLLVLALAPMMGGLYVIFLPCIGFAMVLALAARKTLEALTRLCAGLMATLSPAWLPGVAYFAGERGTRASEETASEAKRNEADVTDLTAR
jgi:hypothetical protein